MTADANTGGGAITDHHHSCSVLPSSSDGRMDVSPRSLNVERFAHRWPEPEPILKPSVPLINPLWSVGRTPATRGRPRCQQRRVLYQ